MNGFPNAHARSAKKKEPDAAPLWASAVSPGLLARTRPCPPAKRDVRHCALAILAHGLILAASILWTASASAEPARVMVRIGLSGVQIDASVRVQADRATLWATLTDYDRLSEFVPSLVVSRVVSAPGQPKRVEQRGDAGMWSFLLPDHVVLAMEEQPPSLIRFRAVSGTVLAMSGEWRLEGNTPPVQLSYRARLMPRVPPPPLLSEGFIEDEVRRRFEAVAQEAERRARIRQ